METMLPPAPVIFSDEQELERLETQNLLMGECEMPLLQEFFAGKSGLNVLDVGSNSGDKTVRWFSHPSVSRVIGLEYNADLAQKAQEQYGDERFHFFVCDAEAEDFTQRLEALMQREGIEAFDLMYLSFVLSHLKSPQTVLSGLRPLLKPGGRIMTIETDDSGASLAPDYGPFHEFLDMLALDPYAGDRSLGRRLPGMLSDCGYGAPAVRCSAISAGPGEAKKKEMLFDMFFSFLPGDVEILRSEAPMDERFIRWENWLRAHHLSLRRAILAPESSLSMGMAVIISERS